MNMKMKQVCLSILFIITLFSLSAQMPGKGRMPQGGDCELSGIVTDDENQALEYVNIRLYRRRDSTLIEGNITNKKGFFKLNHIAFGRYYLLVQFMGYETLKIEALRLTPQQQNLNLGKITLRTAIKDLDEVVITGEKKHIEYQLDKKVVNVDNDLASAGETAVEVLENVPSMQVDIEGNVSMRGSDNFQVLINGRPSILEGSDALKQIPSSNIEKIEIITNPSAKYTADGVGGILNIILKKKRENALDGLVNLSYATKNKYSMDALFSKSTQNWTISLGANYADRDRLFYYEGTDKIFDADTTLFRETDMDGLRHRQSLGLNGGIEYRSKNGLVVNGTAKYGTQFFEKVFISNRKLYYEPATTDDYSHTDNNIEKEDGFYEGAISLTKSFAKHQKLEVYTSFVEHEGLDDQLQKDMIVDDQSHIFQDSVFMMHNLLHQRSTKLLFQVDYTRKIQKDGRLEIGFQGRTNDRLERYSASLYTPEQDWNQANYSFDDGEFSQNIQALYVTYGNKTGNFSYQIGMRGEFSSRFYRNDPSQPENTYRFNDFFPSLHLSQELKNSDLFYTSYSKRIRRPNARQLNPIPQYSDSRNYRVGNLSLEPEYIHSFEVGYQKSIKRSFVSLEAFYRLRKNKFTRLKSMEDGGVMKTTFVNLDRDISSGIELGTNLRLSKKMNLHTTVSYYYYRLLPVDTAGNHEKSSTNIRVRLNGNYKINANLKIQLSMFFMGPSLTLQGKREAMFFSNLSIRKDLLHKKLAISLSIRDIFRTGKYEFITDTEDFYSHATFRRESPVVGINISYVINNFKKKASKKMKNEEEMELDF
jgi:outer membrane receptor protein involved in Fe transport